MKRLMKKAVALAAATIIGMTTLAGCAVKDNEVIFTVGDTSVTADMVKFYANYMQPQYEDYALYMIAYQYQMYGLDMDAPEELDWDAQVAEDVTYAEDFKENYVLAMLQDFYLAKLHMAEYNVELTEEELAEIETAAKTFQEANADETKETISAKKELVTQFLQLRTIYEKVYNAILDTVDRNVADEDAAQKRLRYVSFATTKTNEDGTTAEMSKDEIAAVKAEAEAFLTAAKANGNLEAYAKEVEATSEKLTFDKESTDISKDAIAKADALQENEFAELIETESAYYVIQLESLFDEEATKTEKDSIISERESDKLKEVFDAWEEDSKVVVNEKAWKRLDVVSLKVTQKAAEAEKKEDDKTTDTTTTDETKEDTTEGLKVEESAK